MDDWRGTVLRAAMPSLLFVALILGQPDLGTALVCVVVTVLMLYLAGMQMRYLGLAALGALPVAYYMLFMVPWRRARMMVFLHPEMDPGKNGYQILQSKIAVATGGIFGHGLMEGVQKLFYLPAPHTDFIFANISEELGLLGALAVVALFVLLGYRGLRAAFLVTDPFARFLAFGITCAILIQAFFNMSVVARY
jgi:cell division protein FtsW